MYQGIVVVVVFGSLFHLIDSHGRLIDPPSRSSAWRYRFPTPINYDDNQLFCGGFQRQWEQNNGKCGVCGDPYNGVRENEAGGKYATGTIVRTYKEGTLIDVTVDLTANHGGRFEFRMCPHNDPSTPVTQDCLDKYLLPLDDGTTNYQVKYGDRGPITMRVWLPKGMTCTQCVFQWIYTGGSMWGCSGNNCCEGCGPRQEHFYGCADVAIIPAQNHIITATTDLPHHTASQQQSLDHTSGHHSPQSTVVSTNSCRARKQYQGSKYPYSDIVCQKQCPSAHCPLFMCEDSCMINLLG